MGKGSIWSKSVRAGCSAPRSEWSTKKAITAPHSWRGAYPEAEFSVITPETYQDFVL